MGMLTHLPAGSLVSKSSKLGLVRLELVFPKGANELPYRN
jgi:hypothetical protein